MYFREITHKDLPEYAVLNRNAYPGTGSTIEQVLEMMEKRLEYPDMKTYLAVENGTERILGGLTLLDFTIYQHYNEIKMGGIGGVCVGLDAKKQGVAKYMLSEALKLFAGKDIPISILYPFRHDFYQNMGWGQVGEIKEFKFSPTSLMAYSERKFVRHYRPGDIPGIKQCYAKYAPTGNCSVKRTDLQWERKLLMKPEIFVYTEEEKIQGYLIIGFKKHENSFLNNDLVVSEFIYLTANAYFGLLGFLAGQFDQLSSIIYYTRRTDPFHHLLKEPRREEEVFNRLYHSSQRIGLAWMFRVILIEKYLKSRLNYNGANLDVTLEITDSFLPAMSGIYTLVLKDGKPQVFKGQESKYVVKTDIATFSQLCTNYLTFSDALMIKRIEVNDLAIINSLDKAFTLPEPWLLEFF